MVSGCMNRNLVAYSWRLSHLCLPLNIVKKPVETRTDMIKIIFVHDKHLYDYRGEGVKIKSRCFNLTTAGTFELQVIPEDAAQFRKLPVHFFCRNWKLIPKRDSPTEWTDKKHDKAFFALWTFATFEGIVVHCHKREKTQNSERLAAVCIRS